MKFCGECGAPFKYRCPRCGFDNPPRFKFCGECGSPLVAQPRPPVSSSKFQVSSSQSPAPNTQPPISYTPPHLAERIRAEQAAMEARAASDGERKTVTALFADIKGSMDLIEDLDPEEARAIIDPAIQLMMDAVHRYEGYVVQYTGDGIFALFGAPIVQMRQGLAAWRAAGAEMQQSQALALLAEVYGEVGQAEEGLAEALAVVDKNGEHYYEAELYRLKGELSLQSRQVKDKSKTSQDKSEVRSPESEVEECFWKAIELARRQQAKSLELRAVMSLSRLWQQQGKTAEAQRMLAEIYSWFTEGFDTVDLQEAKALLDELA